MIRSDPESLLTLLHWYLSTHLEISALTLQHVWSEARLRNTECPMGGGGGGGGFRMEANLYGMSTSQKAMPPEQH